MRTVKLAVTLVYFVFADIQEEIADTIDALKTCSKLLTNSPTVPAICYEYIRRRHRQTPYYQAQSGELSRTARRILTHRPTANEIIGPHCFSGPCQRIKFIVSVKQFNRLLPKGFKIQSSTTEIDIGECSGNCRGQHSHRAGFHGHNTYTRGCTIDSHSPIDVLTPNGLTIQHKEIIIGSCKCKKYRICD